MRENLKKKNSIINEILLHSKGSLMHYKGFLSLPQISDYQIIRLSVNIKHSPVTLE